MFKMCSANMVNSETKFFYKENLGFLPKMVCFFIFFFLIHLTVCSSVYHPSEQTNNFRRLNSKWEIF